MTNYDYRQTQGPKAERPSFLSVLFALLMSFALPACQPGRHAEMQRELLRAREMNKAYEPFTTDSVMKQVVAYYDRHGTPNERMEAHYLLGCAYRDMGETPRAVDCYLDAAASADTTATDCDFNVLASIYAQMAWLYHQQLLFSYEIDAHRKASFYNYLSEDTLHAISELRTIAGAYILQNKRDSAEAMVLKAMELYQGNGFIQERLQASLLLMHLYTEEKASSSGLKQLIDKYDTESTYFDERHELHSAHRQFYFYKGKYFEGINQLDSAEYYFRKISHRGMPYTACNSMYDGLLGVFRKLRLPDSIAKYAQLYCAVNDSSIAIKDQELTAQMAASYNYNNYQKKSVENAKKANLLQSYVIALLFIIIICVVLFGVLLHRHVLVKQERQRTIERTKEEIASLTRAYEGKLNQLQQLESSHEKRIETIQKELGKAQEKNKGLATENKESREIILKLNTQFEEEKKSLLVGIKEYADKVGELERQLRIAAYKKNSIPYLKLGIVTRIKDFYAKDVSMRLSEEDLNALVKVTNEYFPDMIGDLSGAPGISTLGIHVCVLVAINLQPNEITHLLGISSAQVGNLKKDINQALFNENTARTLYKNITTHYKIMSS